MQTTKTIIYTLLLLWANQIQAQSDSTVSIRIIEVNTEERDYTYSSRWDKYGAVIIKAEVYNGTADSVHLLADGGRYHRIQPNFWAVEGRTDSTNHRARAKTIPPPPPAAPPSSKSGDPFFFFMKSERYISIAPNERASITIDSDISETYFEASGDIYVRIQYLPWLRARFFQDEYWEKRGSDHPKRLIMEAIREKVYPEDVTSNWYLVQRE